MQCQHCSYRDKAEYCFCPICGKDMIGISIHLPHFAILGSAFDVNVHKSGQTPLSFVRAEYSGREISNTEQDLRSGGVIPLTIKEIPPFNNNILRLHFNNYPARDFHLNIVDPAGLCFSVQGLYDISPFGEKGQGENLLSFSIYDKPALKLNNPEDWLHNCALELYNSEKVIRAVYDPNTQNTYEFIAKDLDGLISNNSETSEIPKTQPLNIQLSLDGKTLVTAPIRIEKNKLPLFKVLNEDQVIQTTFDPGLPGSPFGAVNLEIGIETHNQFEDTSKGSDLRSYCIRPLRQCLFADPRARHQKKEDQSVKLQYLSDRVSEADLAHLRQLGIFEFGVEIEITPNRELPFKPVKRFYFAMPVAIRAQNSGYCVIDFGTSNSCITDENGNLILTQPDDKGNSIPEHKTRIDFIRMGEVADKPIVEYPQSETIANTQIAMNFKSMLINHAQQKYMYKGGDNRFKPFTPVELTSLYLKYLISLIERSPQGRPEEVVATYPASFRKDTRRIYLNQIRALGFQVEEGRCITEPEAIAFYYLNHHEPIRNKAIDKQDITIAVFDCGGGTTDYAIVNYTIQDGDPVTNVLASWGTDKFAGLYISFAVAKCYEKKQDHIPETFARVFDNSRQAEYFRDQYHYYEEEKIKLSHLLNSNPETTNITKDDIHRYLGWQTQSPYFDVFMGYSHHEPGSDIYSIRFQLNQISMVLEELSTNHPLDTQIADFIILAGNSCRLPLFQKYAREVFGEEKVIMDLATVKTAVALGAYTYRSRGDGTEFRGLRRSRFSFFRYLALGELESIFSRWLDMDIENYYLSQDHRKNPFSLRNKVPVQVFSIDADGNESPAFEVPLPLESGAEAAFLEMKYQSFKIWYRWKICKTNNPDPYTDWVQIYDHE